MEDTDTLGRIAFYPIIQNWKIYEILAVIINYNDLFVSVTETLLSRFPESEIEIHIGENKVFDTKIDHEIDKDKAINISSTQISIITSGFEEKKYGNTFVYVFIVCFLVVSFIVITIILLDRDRKRAIRHSRFKSRFIADMSHEIRTPMNGILGMAELLYEQPIGETPMYYVRTIASCGTTLMGIISDILDMSKIEAGVIDIKEETIDVRNMAIRTITGIWETYVLKNGVTIKDVEMTLKVNQNVPERVMGDTVRIQQVISNLLTNSLKFTEKGYVKIDFNFLNMDQDEMFLQVIVEDTGVGMTPKELKEAFTPFNKIHKRKDMGGTGLGLSICKYLCEFMGGKIKCVSTFGIGTTITFTSKTSLPPDYVKRNDVPPFIHICKNGAIKKVQWDLLESSLSDMMEYFTTMTPSEAAVHPNILVVDDVQVNRHLLSKIFDSIGIDVETCDNGLQSVEACDVKKYSMVLMDMVMPIMDGVDACKKIREGGINKDTPIIFVSANVQSISRELCVKAGGNGFITKPISKTSMINLFIKHSSIEEKEYVRRYLHDNI